MAVFSVSNLLFHLWKEGVNRYIGIGTILYYTILYYTILYYYGRLTGSESILLLNRIRNCWVLCQLVKTCMVILMRAISYLTVLTISSVPSQGKNEKSYQEQHEQIGIRIHSKSLAYRRDSCSNGFDLIPKQEEIRQA